MKHSRQLAQVLGCALMLVLAASCASAAPTPTQVPTTPAQAEPLPTITNTRQPDPTEKPAATAAPPSEPRAGHTRVLEPSGITLVFVPAGEFTMGSSFEDTRARDNEKPAHNVYVAAFWMAQTEVTNEQYRRFMEAGGYSTREYWTDEGWQWKEDRGVTQPSNWDDERFDAPQQPVISVNWYEAAAFAAWVGGRLPTEAEWEYAARGGPLSKGYRYAGSDDVDEVAWYYDTAEGHTEPVGQKQPNELGLYDMSGNAQEWCADWYDDGYYAQSPRVNPQGPSSGETVVVRGGYYSSSSASMRCALRIYERPHGGWWTGFRIVVAP